MAGLPGDSASDAPQPGLLPLSACSRHHSLEALAAEVHATYFARYPRLSIRWGHRSAKKSRRSIRLGSYDHHTQEIRIHRLMDSPAVPSFFIQSVIHHEYLHHILGARHNRRFHAHEQKFRYHRESKEWIRRNLGLLLGRKLRARPGRGLKVAAPIQKLVQLVLF